MGGVNRRLRAAEQPAGESFYMIWSPQGVTPPRTRFASQKAAEMASRKLAAANPGREFFVMEAIGVCHVPEEAVPFRKLRREAA